MKIVARVTPDARAAMHKALDKALDEFDASRAPTAQNPGGRAERRLFSFAYDLAEWEWKREPVYDPHDWNSVENIKPPKVGTYRMRFHHQNNPDEWRESRVFWNGEHWQRSAMGELLVLDPSHFASFTSLK